MTSAVCTLFEGDYHFGVGALANSLYAHGFRGTIYAGYRGPLPPWVGGANAETLKPEKLKEGSVPKDRGQKSEPTSDLRPPTSGFTDFSPAEGLTLRFIPLTTKIHLTNYKPDFMLEIWEKHCPQAEAMFYFDPDITIKCRWTFFEEWIEAGVAVCADINPSMPNNHPIRYAWRKILTPHGLQFRNQFETYFNCGFVGVDARDRIFLKAWQQIQSLMKNCGVDFQSLGVGDRTFPFTCRDQDALNITCMATEQKISPLGQDGMDFQHGGGGYIMSHAIGSMKPWNKPFMRTVLRRASPPSRADKEFFKHVETPIRLYSPATLSFKKLFLLAASFLGRFMRNI
jgi:hypothetical protein